METLAQSEGAGKGKGRVEALALRPQNIPFFSMAGLFHHGPKNVSLESTLLISDMIIIPHRPQGWEGEAHQWKGYRISQNFHHQNLLSLIEIMRKAAGDGTLLFPRDLRREPPFYSLVLHYQFSNRERETCKKTVSYPVS
jgi:hypothetical protein